MLLILTLLREDRKSWDTPEANPSLSARLLCTGKQARRPVGLRTGKLISGASAGDSPSWCCGGNSPPGARSFRRQRAFKKNLSDLIVSLQKRIAWMAWAAKRSSRRSTVIRKRGLLSESLRLTIMIEIQGFFLFFCFLFPFIIPTWRIRNHSAQTVAKTTLHDIFSL